MQLHRIALAVAIAFPLSLMAQGIATETKLKTHQVAVGAGEQLPTVVITAANREQPIADVQATVQVITAKDLAGYAGTSVGEALKMAAGVDARPNGSSAFIALRGFISNAGSPVLLLVDGMRRTGKYGSAGLNLFGLESVERIEVVRGPMSALYGADATGGVVNIITKVPKTNASTGGSVYATVGRLGDGQRSTSILGATLAFGTGSTGHRITLEKRNKGEFRYLSSSVLADLNNIDEPYLNYDGVAELAPGHHVHWAYESVNQNDTGPGLTSVKVPFTAYEHERRSNISVRYSGEVGPGLLAVDAARGNSNASTTRSYPNIETTDYTQTQLNTRFTVDTAANSVVVGAGVTQDDLSVSIVPTFAQTRNEHVMLQDEWRISKEWKLLAGLRRDNFSTFGSSTTPRASLSFDPDGPWSFRVGYGEAFRAPAALEQYSRFIRGRFLILGNSAILPEANKTWELATAFRAADLTAEWALFSSDVTNLIQSVQSPAVKGDPSGVTLRSTYSNVGRARLQGSELSAAWRIASGLELISGWDFLDATDTNTGARLTHRARNTYRLGLRYAQGAWRTDLRARSAQGYYASNSVTPPAPTPAPIETSFTTADIKVDYAYSPSMSLNAGVDTLFDQRQPTNYSATGSIQDPPARFFYVGARYKF
jgi:outer membrane receptor for ferrienterochelin and colicin